MKIDEDLAKYQACRVITDSLVYGAGIWPHREDTGLLYKFSAVYGLFVLVVVATKCLFDMLLNMDNISKMIYAFRGMAAMVAPILRMLSCLIYRKEFIFLEKELSTKFNEELEKENNRPTLLKNISLYKTFIYFIFISTSVAAVLYFLPFAIVVFKYKKYMQLYSGKYPFPVEPGGTVYWVVIAFETCSFWFLICGIGGIDNTFGIHCFQIRGFLRLAIKRFNELNANHANYRDELRECVSIHQLVLRAKVALEDAYGYIVIWNYLASAGIMCSVLWELNQVKAQLTVVQVIFASLYILLKLAQAFVYAYFGSIITTESEEYKDAIYMSSWPGSGNVRLMKDLIIILLQRSVNLKACGFFLITMQYFEKICNTTISYFFLVQTLADNN